MGSWLTWIRLPQILWRLMWDRRMPLGPKAALVIAIAYLLVPMGIIPDRAFGILGYIDDAALLALATAWFLIRAPEAAVRDAVDGR